MLKRGLKANLVCLAATTIVGAANAQACETCRAVPGIDGETPADPQLAHEDFLPEELEQIRGCGLPGTYAPVARTPPRMIQGDFDGDDAFDHATFVKRVSDDARGIAICRAGTWLDLLGFDGPVPGSPMQDDYFAMVEAWRVSTMDDVPGGWVGEAPRPRAVGDVLILERFEKALYSLYWNGEAFRSHQHYRYVEP